MTHATYHNPDLFTINIGSDPRSNINFINTVGSFSMERNFASLFLFGWIYIDTSNPINDFIGPSRSDKGYTGNTRYDQDYSTYCTGIYYGSPTTYSNYIARVGQRTISHCITHTKCHGMG